MNFLKSLPKNEIFILFVICILNYFFLIINVSGVYWDGWTLVNQDNLDWTRQFLENGTWFFAIPVHFTFLNIANQIVGYRIATFFFYFMSSVMLLFSLRKLFSEQYKAHLFALTIFFTVLPINPGKISLICMIFTVGYFLYFLFLYLYTHEKFKILSYLILFLSFGANSLLVFHYGLFLVLFFIQNDFKEIKQTITPFLKKNIIVLTLPLFYFIIKQIFFKPNSIYEGYNSISFESLLNAFPHTYTSIKLFFQNQYGLISISLSDFALIALFSFLFLVLLKNKISIHSFFSFKKISLMLISGFFLLFVALFPYAAVEKFAAGPSINTRFELLTPIGASLIYLAVILLFNKITKIKFKYIVILCISLFTVINIKTYLAYLGFWIENLAFENYLKTARIPKQNISFYFERGPRTSYQEGILKSFSFYELSGISRKVFKKSDKLFSTQNKPEGYPFDHGKVAPIFIERKHYNLHEYKEHDYQYKIKFMQLIPLTAQNILTIWYKYHTNQNIDQDLNLLFKLEAIKL